VFTRKKSRNKMKYGWKMDEEGGVNLERNDHILFFLRDGVVVKGRGRRSEFG
jgi:hypothetical protein